MNETVPLVPTLINVLSIVLNLLNACFLTYVWFENRKTSYQGIYQKKEIQSYIEFSLGALLYVTPQAVLLMSNVFELNLWMHRVQHIGIAVALISFIRLPRHIFNVKNESNILRGILIGLICATIPLMFTPWFILPVPVKFGSITQGTPGFLYVGVLAVHGLVFLINLVKSGIYAVGNARLQGKLATNEIGFIIGSLVLLVFNGIAILKLSDNSILSMLDNSASSIGFTMFSFIITVMLTMRYGITLRERSEKEGQLKQIRDNIEKEYEDILSTIVEILERDDQYTAGHSRRVMQISMEIAKAMGLRTSVIDKIEITGILHDIGKLGVSKLVLNKPGRLTEDEFRQIKRHSELGFDIVSTYKPLFEIATYVKAHHEKLNGEGYPDRLTDEKIPEIAKIISVADIYDALSSKRPYREGLELDKCLQIMQDMANNHEIDRTILAKLEKIIPNLKIEG
ncbi:MAG: HD domain-containing protein [Brevinematales bacterium]|nr:HD domain-containing protein [Brevinematales bacterium]